jgi:hypothetical protein
MTIASNFEVITSPSSVAASLTFYKSLITWNYWISVLAGMTAVSNIRVVATVLK